VAYSRSVRYADGGSKAVWRFVCDCGTVIEAHAHAARSGNTRSCGCLHAETSASNSRGTKLIDYAKAYTRVLKTYRANASKAGRVFALTDIEAQNLLLGDCYYCGAPPQNLLVTQRGKQLKMRYNGIDRVDNFLGYTPANTVSCCPRCNHAKRNYPTGEFLAWAERLVAFQKSKQ